MPVIVDTGPLLGYLNRDDPLHPRAVKLMERVWDGELGVPASTDTVLDEGLTFLRRKVGREDLSRSYAAYFLGDGERRAPLHLRDSPLDILEEALALHFDHYERGLSFTDCTLVAHARRVDGVVATFDGGFHGLVGVAED